IRFEALQKSSNFLMILFEKRYGISTRSGTLLRSRWHAGLLELKKCFLFQSVAIKRPLGGSAAGLLHGVSFVVQNLEGCREAGDFEQALDALRRVQHGHVTFSVTDRGPDRNELAEAGTVDVAHALQIQNKVLLALRQQAVDEIT